MTHLPSSSYLSHLRRVVADPDLGFFFQQTLNYNVLGPIVFVTPEIGRFSTVGGKRKDRAREKETGREREQREEGKRLRDKEGEREKRKGRRIDRLPLLFQELV
jgi:hypothetical protein